MNKRLISKIMHQRVAGLGSSSIYFFRGDYEYILQGVALEYVPRGLYIWNFKSPLFDFYGLSLSYSSRLPERGFIAKGEMTEAEIVDHVMSSPAAQANFGSDAQCLLGCVSWRGMGNVGPEDMNGR
ncbi:MAG: hypothetical protein RSA54_13455 [Glutamicibacter sp.]|uniref:hypothetical protein n=1 Tax=Stenotrophomonas sp. TaxID=69392 RepID=UPI002FC5EC60